MTTPTTDRIQVLGPGCGNCERLRQRTADAVAALGHDLPVSSVHDPEALLAHGVMRTPALVVDGRLLLSGRVPTATHLQELLREPLAGPAPA